MQSLPVQNEYDGKPKRPHEKAPEIEAIPVPSGRLHFELLPEIPISVPWHTSETPGHGRRPLRAIARAGDFARLESPR